MTKEPEHTEISPSMAKRVEHCAGCVRLSRGIKDEPSEYAKEGTAAHFVAEHCLRAGCNTSDLANGTDTFVHPDHKPYITQDMFDHVQLYIDTVNNDRREGDHFGVEDRFDMGWIYGGGLAGTTDAWIGEEFGLLRVYDLKYGQGIVVEPDDNPQQKLYALGVLGPNNPMMYDEVELVIVQPRAPHPDGPVRRWRCSVDELYAWAKEFGAKCKATEDPSAPFCAGEWCADTFCPALPVCPEVVLAAADSAMIEFGADEPIDSVVTNVTIPAPEAMTESQVAKALDFAKILSTWMKKLEAYAQSRMESGILIPGYKLVSKKSNRKWKDEQRVVDELELLYGDDIFAEQVKKLRSPAQMEKLTGIDKAALTLLWEKPNTGNTIAAEGDKREAVQPSAVEDFLD